MKHWDCLCSLKRFEVKVYKNKKASLAKSAEIAGLTTIEFKEVLADRGVKREIEGDEIAEIDKKIKEVFG